MNGLVFLNALIFVVVVSSAEPLSILCLGDDVVVGNSNHKSWRESLKELLASDGFEVQYVGNIRDAKGLAHEGRAGWSTAAMRFGSIHCTDEKIGCKLENWSTKWPKQFDIALLYMGSADVIGNDEITLFDETTENAHAVVSWLRGSFAQKGVVMAKLLPISNKDHKQKISLLNELYDVLDARSTEILETSPNASPLVFADMHPLMTDPDRELLEDGFVPVAEVQEKMAQEWHSAIKKLLLLNSETNSNKQEL